MTLRTLFVMAMARREQQRIHACDISSTVNYDGKKKRDLNHFIKTGEMVERQQIEIEPTPQIQSIIDRIRKNNGRLVFEDN